MFSVTRLLALLALPLLFAACSTPPDKNNVECKALPTCEVDESEVSTCEAKPDCREVTLCGETIFCAPTIEISASDYDQSCESALDCALIHEGDPCECKVCPDGAINSDSAFAYAEDIAAAICAPIDCPAIACGEEIRPYCVDNVCEALPAKYASTDGYDQSCETEEDCVSVWEGDVCAECQCHNAAINASEAERYREQFDPDCAVPSPCDCAPSLISCNAGTCEVE